MREWQILRAETIMVVAGGLKVGRNEDSRMSEYMYVVT